MIVKFLGNKGGGSAGATIDYLLGKDRDRPGAVLLSGDPELTQRLADNLDFQNRYTVGVLSFEELNLEEQQKEAIMQSFEETLLAGLERDQYDITWIEHTDKGRLELNFVIPNVELSTGKRLQPYFDQADRPLVENWKQVTNFEHGLTDPHAPEKAQAIKTLNSQNLPSSEEKQMKYIDEKYANRPEFGTFYGKNANLNMETLISAGPQVVIDLGEPKDDIKEGMDTIQKQTDIPTIFIEATFDKLPEAYITLGKVLGEEEQANKLSLYCKEALDLAKSNAQKVTTKPKVFYAEGENGLTTIGAGSIHSEAIEFIGAENVAKLEKGSKSGAEISMEQLINWNPDVIIAADEKVYELITTDSAWSNLKAVQEKKVYQSPSLPYNWVGRPPSVNRILGMQWLGTLLFFEEFKYDMVKQSQEFYKLFYHYDLSEEEAKEMLKNSTLKEM